MALFQGHTGLHWIKSTNNKVASGQGDNYCSSLQDASPFPWASRRSRWGSAGTWCFLRNANAMRGILGRCRWQTPLQNLLHFSDPLMNATVRTADESHFSDRDSLYLKIFCFSRMINWQREQSMTWKLFINISLRETACIYKYLASLLERAWIGSPLRCIHIIRQ